MAGSQGGIAGPWGDLAGPNRAGCLRGFNGRVEFPVPHNGSDHVPIAGTTAVRSNTRDHAAGTFDGSARRVDANGFSKPGPFLPGRSRPAPGRT